MKRGSPPTSKRRGRKKGSKKKKVQQQTVLQSPFLRTSLASNPVNGSFGIGLSSSLVSAAVSIGKSFSDDSNSKSNDGSSQIQTESEVIRIPIIFGNVSIASELREDTQWYEWTVYVRGLRNEDLSYCIDRVVFILHPDFTNPVRVIDEPPFEVSEQGWGDFPVDICIFAKSGVHMELKERLKKAHPDWKGHCEGIAGCQKGRIDGLPSHREKAVTIADLTSLPSAETLQKHHRSRQGRLYGGETFDMDEDGGMMMSVDGSDLSTNRSASNRRRKSRRLSNRKGGKISGEVDEEETTFGQDYAFGVDMSGMSSESILARDVAALKESGNLSAQRVAAEEGGNIPGMVRVSHYLTLCKDGSQSLIRESLCELLFHCTANDSASQRLRSALLRGPHRSLSRHRYHDLWVRSTMDLCESEQSLIKRILSCHEQVLTEMAPLIAEFNARFPAKIVPALPSSAVSSNPSSMAVPTLPRSVGRSTPLFAAPTSSVSSAAVPTIPLIPPPNLIQQPPLKRHRKS